MMESSKHTSARSLRNIPTGGPLALITKKDKISRLKATLSVASFSVTLLVVTQAYLLWQVAALLLLNFQDHPSGGRM